jgi:hypothetical protein
MDQFMAKTPAIVNPDSKPLIKIFRCKHHPKEKLVRVNSDRLETDSLKCIECLIPKEEKQKMIPFEMLASMSTFLDQAANLYEFVRNFSSVEETIPTELTESLGNEKEMVTKLQEYIKEEKKKVDKELDAIAAEFSELIAKKKEELFKVLDEQSSNLKANLKYYQTKLDKYFGKEDVEETNPTKEQLLEKVNGCRTYEDLEFLINSIKDDMEEISIYGKDSETRSRKIREAMKEFVTVLVQSTNTYPICMCSNEEQLKILRTSFKTSTAKLFESMVDIQNPIDIITLSGAGGIGSSIITKGPDVKLLKSWITNSHIKFKLIYKATKDGFTAAAFHQKCDNISHTLVIVRSDKGKTFGGYLDLPWSSASSYNNTSKSWLFSMDAREKYPVKSGQSQYGGYGQSGYGPTWGGGHDLHICNDSNTVNSSYSNYAYTFEAPFGMTYGSSQAQSHLAGSYNFKTEEIEVFQLEFREN